MNCEELRQNTAAYVLGALSESETAEFTRHAADCDVEHEVESLQEVVSRLSEAVPPMEPPAGLRGRIIAAAEADEATYDQKAALSPIAEAWQSSPAAAKKTFDLRRLSTTAYAAAAIALIVLGAAIGWAATTVSSGDQPVALRHFHREGDGDWLRVEADLGEPGMTLSVGNLDPLTSQSTYEFWAIRGETWIKIGQFNTNPQGRWAGKFDFALEKGDSIAITVEPEGGSEAPTSDAEIRTGI